MKAAVFHASDRPLVVEEIADPVPGPRDLVVEVRACGICGTDLHAASQPGGLPTGCVMGHEFSGVVVETGGEAASDFSTGDRVIAVPSMEDALRVVAGSGGPERGPRASGTRSPRADASSRRMYRRTAPA